MPMLNDAAGAAGAADRYRRSAALDVMRPSGERSPVGAAVTQAALHRLAGSCREVPLLARRCPFSAITRRATAARSAARSPMPIPSAELPLVLAGAGRHGELRSAKAAPPSPRRISSPAC